MIQAGFHLHKQAVLLEYNLNRFVKQKKKQAQCDWADITMIYEQPIHLMREILQEVKKQAILSEREDWFIHMISERYAPYEHYVLAQLDEDIACSLCADLIALNENVKTC